MAAFVDVRHALSDLDHNLLEVFCGNIAVAFENTHLLQRISELAYEDSLLKMPNRNRFLAHIDQRQSTSDRLALVDLDGFADINSVLDQDFGDAVLQAVAYRLRHAFPEDVHIARIGSDVFGLLGSQTEVNPGTIEAVFSTPFEVGAESFRLSATSGLVRLGDTRPRVPYLDTQMGTDAPHAQQHAHEYPNPHADLHPVAYTYPYAHAHAQQAQALVHGLVHALKWLQTAEPADVVKHVPTSGLLAERSLFLAALARARDAMSPDGLMPEDAPRTALRALSVLNPAMAVRQSDLARSYTQEFARKAKQKYSA